MEYILWAAHLEKWILLSCSWLDICGTGAAQSMATNGCIIWELQEQYIILEKELVNWSLLEVCWEYRDSWQLAQAFDWGIWAGKKGLTFLFGTGIGGDINQYILESWWIEVSLRCVVRFSGWAIPALWGEQLTVYLFSLDPSQWFIHKLYRMHPSIV